MAHTKKKSLPIWHDILSEDQLDRNAETLIDIPGMMDSAISNAGPALAPGGTGATDNQLRFALTVREAIRRQMEREWLNQRQFPETAEMPMIVPPSPDRNNDPFNEKR